MSGLDISEAVVLMAGSGSRLRASSESVLKPLVPVLGRPLIAYTLDALRYAGIKIVYAVIGFEGETIRAAVRGLAPRGLDVRFIENPHWSKQNGVSVLAAAPFVSGRFVLTMSDHLFDQELLDDLIRNAPPAELCLAVDRKLGSIFDLDDAMKVQTDGDRIVTLAKDLQVYDAIDTGVFVCAPELFAHLARAADRGGGDCSLADGVRSMAEAGVAQAVDIENAWWQDIDTAEMLAGAESHLRSRAVADHV